MIASVTVLRSEPSLVGSLRTRSTSSWFTEISSLWVLLEGPVLRHLRSLRQRPTCSFQGPKVSRTAGGAWVWVMLMGPGSCSRTPEKPKVSGNRAHQQFSRDLRCLRTAGGTSLPIPHPGRSGSQRPQALGHCSRPSRAGDLQKPNRPPVLGKSGSENLDFFLKLNFWRGTCQFETATLIDDAAA